MKARVLWATLLLGLFVGIQSSAYPMSTVCRVSDFNTCSSEDLLGLMSNTLDNDSSPNLDLVEMVKDELIKRKAIDSTYKFFSNTEYFLDQVWAYKVLDALRSKRVDELLRSDATDALTLRAYYANSYFAEVGTRFALANLNKNYFKYETSSVAWMSVVKLFGKYRYYPAKANLVSTIDAAEVDLGEASLESLELLYPETEAIADKMNDPEKLTAFYSDYIKTH